MVSGALIFDILLVDDSSPPAHLTPRSPTPRHLIRTDLAQPRNSRGRMRSEAFLVSMGASCSTHLNQCGGSQRHTLGSNNIAMASSAASGLLSRQLKLMQSDKDIPGISCGLVDNNVFEWEVMLMISDDCKYYGGLSCVSLARLR